ncbi:MAG: phosphoribosylformylglycinamidine synthase subunit PurQ [Caulobacterales bacterium]|nr:phosphoribosylformylglycinamidine synthase subunit PurQ [Caulobacterales bacterium]
MKSAVIVFPGSNCDRDARTALRAITGRDPAMVWHAETHLPEHLDLIVVPGGFSHGDYLRCGAMAARAPIVREVAAAAARGVTVIGVCNGFQILCEAGLLPGALIRNASLTFVCRRQPLSIEAASTRFTAAYGEMREIILPIAHHDGAYIAGEDELDRLEGEGQVVFRYRGNPNGSLRDIAGISDNGGRVLGMMPHPERAVDPDHGGVDGRDLFRSVMEAA